MPTRHLQWKETLSDLTGLQIEKCQSKAETKNIRLTLDKGISHKPCVINQRDLWPYFKNSNAREIIFSGKILFLVSVYRHSSV